MDYEGVVSNVYYMRERAKYVLREWKHTQFRFGSTQDQWRSFIEDCNYFLRRLYVEGKTQRIVFP